MQHDHLIELEHRHILQTYKRLPVVVDRTEGMEIIAHDGTRYLDFLGGIAVNALGHSHPDILAAIDRQSRRYLHISNYFYQDAQIDFARKLTELSGYSRVFLSNSGTEANEGAMKLARAWGAAQSKREIIGFGGGFHGRTYGVLSVMDKPAYKDGMGPFLPETRVLPFNDVAALRATVGPGTCALIVEFLQGEGGIHAATPEFVVAIEELRREHGVLLIADEIQGGAGRTGTFHSFEHHGVRPDIVTLAKGIGGGLPLGAILVDAHLAEVWSSGRHGTTFGGNALSCAAGSVVLDHLASGLMDHVAAMGRLMIERLEALKAAHPQVILDVRGAGCIIGVEVAVPAGQVVDAMLAQGVIVNATADRTVRLLPPYIVTAEQIERMIEAFENVLRTLQASGEA